MSACSDWKGSASIASVVSTHMMSVMDRTPTSFPFPSITGAPLTRFSRKSSNASRRLPSDDRHVTSLAWVITCLT